MSSASRPAIPCSRARLRRFSTNPRIRSWINSGDSTPSSSRSWLTATKHSEVISLILSIARPSAGAGDRQELDLHARRIERRRQVDGDRLLLHDVLPVLAPQVQLEVG